MKLALTITSLSIALLGLTAAGATERQPTWYHFKIDRLHMDASLRAVLEEDLQRLATLEINAPKDSLFAKIFGGTDTASVQRYLNQRIRYIVVDHIWEPSFAANYSWNWLRPYAAQKLGLEDNTPTSIEFENTQIEITGPRRGVFGLGSEYAGTGSSQQKPMGRLDTLIHEARHSDCPKIPSMDQLQLLIDRNYEAMNEEGISCIYSHIHCDQPTRDDFGDCDSVPYGAYGVAYVFSDAIANYCTNCTKTELAQARANAKDDLSRLRGGAKEKLLHWRTQPVPDMSSIR